VTPRFLSTSADHPMLNTSDESACRCINGFTGKHEVNPASVTPLGAPTLQRTVEYATGPLLSTLPLLAVFFSIIWMYCPPPVMVRAPVEVSRPHDTTLHHMRTPNRIVSTPTKTFWNELFSRNAS
jgi:hypothetical protein